MVLVGCGDASLVFRNTVAAVQHRKIDNAHIGVIGWPMSLNQALGVVSLIRDQDELIPRYPDLRTNHAVALLLQQKKASGVVLRLALLD